MNINVRLAGPEDHDNFSKWITSTKDNLFDRDILKYPNLRILAVERDSKVLMYFPFQVALIGESLALNPDADPKELAYGFRHLDTSLRKLAGAYGIREMFFSCAEKSFSAFAARHGWAEVVTKFLKSKVKP